MFGREIAQSTPLAPVDTTERLECKGRILDKTPYLSGAYTYFAIAILVEFPDGGKEEVLHYSSSGSGKVLALCKPGHEVKVNVSRSKPDSAWYVQDFVIVYDIEREKAALAKLID
jgi:hypothetical protein